MPRPIRRITVGTALLGEADPVLRTAVALARQTGAELHLVHVYDSHPSLETAYREYALGEDGNPGEREEVEGRLAGHLNAIAPAMPAVLHALEGTASERLVERADELDSDLLILGATRQDRVWRHYLGTTAHAVIARAQQPILLLRQPLLRPLERVLFPSDISELSAAVHRRGIELLAALFGEDDPEIRSLLVLPRRPPDAPAPLPGFFEFAEQKQAEFLAGSGGPPCRVRARLREGDPAECIVGEVSDWRADLLVLGTHSREGRFSDLGRVAGATLRDAPCNVLVLPSAGTVQVAAVAGRSWPAQTALPRLQTFGVVPS
jgi:universal stress protein E